MKLPQDDLGAKSHKIGGHHLQHIWHRLLRDGVQITTTISILYIPHSRRIYLLKETFANRRYLRETLSYHFMTIVTIQLVMETIFKVPMEAPLIHEIHITITEGRSFRRWTLYCFIIIMLLISWRLSTSCIHYWN